MSLLRRWFLSPFGVIPLAYVLFYAPYLAIGVNEQVKLLIVLGFGAYLFGAALLKFIDGTRRAQVRASAVPVRSQGMLYLISLYTLTWIIALWIVGTSGLPILSADMETARTLVVQQSGGWAYYMFRTNAFLAATTLLVYAFLRKKPGLLLAGAIALSLLLPLAYGYRSNFLIPVLFAAMSAFMLGRLTGRMLVVFGTASVAFIGAYGAIRAITHSDVDFLERLGHEGMLAAMNLERIYDTFPTSIAFFRGGYVLSGFESLLPGQQQSAGLLLKEMLALNFQGGGFAPSLLGGFYIDGGWIVTLVAMFALGVLVGVSFRQANTGRFWGVLSYTLITVYMVFFIRGGFLAEVFPLWTLLVIASIPVVDKLRWGPARPCLPGHLRRSGT